MYTHINTHKYFLKSVNFKSMTQRKPCKVVQILILVQFTPHFVNYMHVYIYE